VNDIHVRLGLRQSQASQHLKVLKHVGLVEMEPRAQQRLYGLRPEPLKQLHEWLDRYRHIWEERFEALTRSSRNSSEGTIRCGRQAQVNALRETKQSWSARATVNSLLSGRSMRRRISFLTHGQSPSF
jgi:DNA-binding IclR family transcriptional regulator